MYRKITDEIVVITDVSSNIEKLGGSFWMVDYNQDLGYHLVKQPSMSLPSKVYGHNTSNSDKIFDTFKLDVGRTTGVMLQGEKGTGKTLTATEVCLKAVAEGYPVILIQSEFYGTGFNDFMSSIQEPCVVFIDEFEKVFKKQDAIDSTLMLLDGAIKTHKLYLLTSNISLNSSDRMEFLTNRPSRVKYVFEYGSVSKEVIAEYLQDNLHYPVYTDDVYSLQRNFKLFTIDMLKAIVVEINRFGDSKGTLSLTEIIQDLNVKTDRTISSYAYEKVALIGGKAFPISQIISPDYAFYFGAYNLEQLIDGDTSTLSLHIPLSQLNGVDLESYAKLDMASAVSMKITTALRSPTNKAIADEVDRLLPKYISGELQIKDLKQRANIEKETDYDTKVSNIKSAMLHEIEVVHFELSLEFETRENGAYFFTQDQQTRALILNFADCDLKLIWQPDIAKHNSRPKFII